MLRQLAQLIQAVGSIHTLHTHSILVTVNPANIVRTKNTMPPNPTPAPATQSTPSSQASIRNYMRPGNSIRRIVRDTVSSVLALPDGAQGGEHSMDTEDIGVVDENEETRKRNREDSGTNEDEEDESILGTDRSQRDISDSLIANTSITGARRRRISAVSETPQDITAPGDSPTPNILLQMESISETANIFHQGMPELQYVQHTTGDAALSAQSNVSNTNIMLDGISALTNRAISTTGQVVGAPTQVLEWDHEGMTPPVNLSISPLPVPDIQDTAQPRNNSQPVEAVESTSQVEIMQVVRAKMEDFFKTLGETLTPITEKMEEINMVVEQNRQAVEDNAVCIAQNTEAVENTKQWIGLVEETQELHARDLEDLNVRMAAMDTMREEVTSVIEQNTSAVEDNRNNIERLESSVSVLQRGGPPMAQMQVLLDRVQALEKKQEESQRLLHQYETDRERERDHYYLKSISLRGFSPPKDEHHRKMARTVLASIGCEDVLSSVEFISFSRDKTDLRLTFFNISDQIYACQWLGDGISRIKRNGHNINITFRTLTPPRFAQDRKKLNEIGMQLKNDGQCKRFYFIIKNNKLLMKIHMPGMPDRIIEAPKQQQDMDTDVVVSCPICSDPYSASSAIAVYQCGHTYHEACLAAVLEGQGLRCPTCREAPQNISTDMVNCEQCTILAVTGPDVRTENLCVSSKCYHVHTLSCQTRYLTSRQADVPSTRETVEQMRLNEQFMGCYTCNQGQDRRSMKSEILYTIQFSSGISDFVDLGLNSPGVRPRRYIPANPSVQDIVGSSPPAVQIAQIAPPGDVLSGANRTAMGPARNRNSPRNLGSRRERNTSGDPMRARRGRRDHTPRPPQGRERSPIRGARRQDN